MKVFEKFFVHTPNIDTENNVITFHYSFDAEEYFEERILFPDTIDHFSLDILRHVAVGFGISYFKAFPTREIIVESVALGSDDVTFWERFYREGLGEFYYQNQLDPSDFGTVIGVGEKTTQSVRELSDRILLPIGGGKDSDVAIERIRSSQIDTTLFTFGSKDRDVFIKTQEVSGFPRIHVERRIDPKLFEWNAQGYYNGHVPITGLISLLLVVIADGWDFRHVVLSNESSANYGNTTWKGIEVNHQYSKSLAFENDLREYISRNLSSQVNYFSLLRDMSEYAIAHEFVKHPKYFPVFSSCNSNFTITKDTPSRWCLSCPKCAFVFSLLHPLLSQDQRQEVFGGDMYASDEHQELFEELLGVREIKPFECVGEPEEVHASMCHSLLRQQNDLAPLLHTLQERGYLDVSTFVKEDQKLLKRAQDHNIPHRF